ncbi:MAG: hypothetical protein JNL32_06120 [Candidatus Kapabacteria bacterium]|nr:hypothetical protein [Candidatus Kapabacteria bacterium]
MIHRYSRFTMLATLVAIALAFCSAMAQDAAYQTFITRVIVNNTDVPPQSWNTLAVSPNDIVKVAYECRNSSTNETIGTNVRFEFDVDNGEGRNSTSTTETMRVYSALSNGVYSIKIAALSTSGEWRAVPTTLRFTVDENAAKIFAEESKPKQDSTAVQEQGASSSPSLLTIILVAIGSAIIAAGAGLLLGKKLAASPSAVLPAQPAVPFTAPIIAPEPKFDDKYLKHLEEESKKQSEEIQTLRSQIDQLRQRADKLGDQNMDLSTQVQRLSDVKRELEELQTQKDDLFAIIIHDIKNPASLIKNLVDLLRNYDLNSQETQEVMQDIVETTTKIVSLSQEFSKIMAVDSAQLQIAPFETDVSEIIESVCRRNAVSGDKKGIKIFTDIPDTLPHAEFDPQKIEEVLDNLISNAIKFSMQGSYVYVRVLAQDTSFTIEVEDKGLGLSEDDVKKAFQRGMKLGARPTAGEPSSGLGLWIVKRLVEAHHGSVWLRSTLGKGSTFGIVLPFKQPVI